MLRRADAEAIPEGAADGATVLKQVADQGIICMRNTLGRNIRGVTFNVVKSFESLPAHICARAAEQEARGAWVVYYGGLACLVWDCHKTTEQFEQRSFHELSGRLGLNR